MKQLLISGLAGNIEVNAQRKIREEIQNRWEGMGFLNGLQGHVKETVATLYESQAKHLIYEATTADNSGSFETVVFPLIRRVFSKLLANDIVSVQAMNLPIGKLFFIKPVTSEREWSFQNEGEISDGDRGKHNGLMGYQRRNRLFNGEDFTGEKPYSEATGTDRRTWESYARYGLPDDVVDPVQTDARHTTPKPTTYLKKALYDLFYYDFLFDQSKGAATIKIGNAVPVMLMPDGTYRELESADDILVDSKTNSITHLMLAISGFSPASPGRLIGPDGNEMDTESFISSLRVLTTEAIENSDENTEYTTFVANEEVIYRLPAQLYGHQIAAYTNICEADGKVLIELDFTKPSVEQGKSITGYMGINPDQASTIFAADTMFKVAWVQYDSLELETEMGEVSFQLTSVTVAVEERKLRATWSPELAQDVAAFHNIDAEAELTAILSEQISAEIDREILRDIRRLAPWTARWDYNGWQRLAGTSTVYTQKDWNQTLITKINQISAQIQKSTLRGGADWVVVSAEISAVLNDLEYFHVSDASAESDNYNMGIEKIGSLQGRYRVIVDPYAPHWSLIMGHHGSSLLDTGYIYAPYVPLALTPTMYNPMNFAPVKGIVTRYAKKIVNNKYYGAIHVDGLVYWNPMELR